VCISYDRDSKILKPSIATKYILLYATLLLGRRVHLSRKLFHVNQGYTKEYKVLISVLMLLATSKPGSQSVPLPAFLFIDEIMRECDESGKSKGCF
jgi:hypothetical protein